MLTPGEQILAASDRASAPLTCGLFVQTTGRLDPARLRAAVWTVIRRHPMARAVLYGSRQHAWRFAAEPTADPVGFVDDGTDGWRIHEILSSAPFDLRRYPPIRVALVRRADGDQLSVVAHHLAFDGLRLAALVTEILDHYRETAYGEDRDGAVVPGEGHRGVPAGVQPLARAGAPGWAALVRRSGRYITPLTVGGDGYGFHPLILPASGGRRTLPDGRRMTINDLLIGAAHLAIDRWNSRRGGESGRLRIRMPVDLASSLSFAASPSSSSFPAPSEISGNRTGQTIISSEVADRVDSLQLAVRVVDQTGLAKQVVPPPVPGLSGALGIAAARFVPGPWRSTLLRCGVAVGRPVLAPTAAVSNLGRFDDLAGAAGLPISAVYFTGTAGMPQGLFIGVLGMGDSLYVTFGYHRHLLGPGSVPAFADLFRAAYAELADTGATVLTPATAPAPAVARAPRPDRAAAPAVTTRRGGAVPSR
ncbi:condensation domain-containing protein [Frankia sp. QA3]|uniref:condensation domain-containing protein n=1 Tax=Frankia sp. QA3 TaxID=710111 RepID=UPI0003160953|nr:condensation domain-containing protein [Frankia sp. QA3]